MNARVRATDNWAPGEFDLKLAAELDRTPTAARVQVGAAAPATALGATAAAGERLLVWLQFDGRDAFEVSLRLAVSFTGAERARCHLAAQIAGWDIGQLRRRAADGWSHELGRVEVAGPEGARRRFYSSFRHVLTCPRDRAADRGFGLFWDDHYTLWDTHRTALPLLTLIKPSTMAGVIGSFVRSFEEQGSADTAFIAGRNYHVGQGGDEVDIVLADAFAKRVGGVDWRRAYRVMRLNADRRRGAGYRDRGWFAVEDPSPDAPRHPRAESDGWKGFVRPRFANGRCQAVDPKHGWDGTRYENIGSMKGRAGSIPMGRCTTCR